MAVALKAPFSVVVIPDFAPLISTLFDVLYIPWSSSVTSIAVLLSVNLKESGFNNAP